MPYEIGDRVQATRYYLKRQQKTYAFSKSESSMGVIQGWRSPRKFKGELIAIYNVRWFREGSVYPPHHDQDMRGDYIEPYGSKR